MTDAFCISKPLRPEDMEVSEGWFRIKGLASFRIDVDSALDLAGKMLDYAVDELRTRATDAERREQILQDLLDRMEGYR